jgi:hypothetical protein
MCRGDAEGKLKPARRHLAQVLSLAVGCGVTSRSDRPSTGRRPRGPLMPDTRTTLAQGYDHYAVHRMAAAAAAKSRRLWPNVIGEVLAGEIMALMDLPLWLQSQTRTQQLIDVILSIPEAAERSCQDRAA